MSTLQVCGIVSVSLAIVSTVRAQTPLGTAFTYQGRLEQAGAPLAGTADLQFSLWDAAGSGSPPSGGTQIGVTQTVSGVSVTNGLFTVQLNAGVEFGAIAFNGDARWLQIAVRFPAGTGGYTPLSPRQSLTAAPYALKVPGIDGHSLDAADGSPVDGLFVNNGGNVGIGTTNPQGVLEVVSGTNSYVRVDNTYGDLHANGGTDGAFGIYNDSGPAGRTEIIGQGIPRLAVTNSGNVGIGTNTPNFQLSLGTTLSHTKIALYDSSSTNHYGMGVVSGQFSFHLNSPSARYAFYDSDDLTNEVLSVHGNGVTRVKVLEITGADLAEKFPTSEKVEPGMVVAIDPENPGRLCLSRGAYNRCVAGIVSGANGFAGGTVLGNLPGLEDAPPIALSGRVYVWCDASSAAIEPGDLLTTSQTAGHAMKAVDPSRTPGAVLGKAMNRLSAGKIGLILALVSLQ